jgi:hypothetical protein
VILGWPDTAMRSSIIATDRELDGGPNWVI